MALMDADLEKALLDKALLSAKALKELTERAKNQYVSLEQFLFDQEVLSDEELGRIVAELYGVPFVRLADKTISDSLLKIVPYALASHQYVIPFEQMGVELKVAISDPFNDELLESLEKKTGFDIIPCYATKKDIKAALKFYNRDVHQKFTTLLKGALADPTKIESLKDAAKILDTIILSAYQNNASDIHLEPRKEVLCVRYRMDGILHTIAELPMSISSLLMTRIKVLSNIRTDEHRAAQDGRFKIELENNEITMRVSIVPVYEGEKTVLRLLSSTHQELNLELLGYSPKNLEVINNTILKTHGILLITGPTGSGKTTTLYAMLKLLNSPEINISTIEDPIEYRLEGINQIQVNTQTNLTFAAGLRALLRQDPDIVMVGEIRDEETASIAINAALTGHLVLATLHTNDAASTLARLLEMNVEGFLLAATAQLVIAQRLVRKICENCKTTYTLPLDELQSFGAKFHFNQDLKLLLAPLIDPSASTLKLTKGEGCMNCNGSGYKGRISVAEVMEVSDSIKKLILRNASPKEIEEASTQEGMITMFSDGLLKVVQGTTTLEEVLRVMRS